MPIEYKNVYVEASAFYLPGEGVSNEEMDVLIAPINRFSKRVKSKVLAENGIQCRHYALDSQGQTQISHADMAAEAPRYTQLCKFGAMRIKKVEFFCRQYHI